MLKNIGMIQLSICKTTLKSDEFKGKDVAESCPDDLDSIARISMRSRDCFLCYSWRCLNENLQDAWAIMNSALYSN